MKIHFETLGCKLNQIESESAANSFHTEGFSISMKPLTRAEGEQNDVILCIVNTCTVTGKAEQKARRLIHLLLDLCPHCPIIVTGCYAELDAESIASIHNRIIILPGSQKGLLTSIAVLLKNLCTDSNLCLDNKLTSDTASIFLESFKKGISNLLLQSKQLQTAFTLSTDTFFQHSRSSIKIQDGCNNHCTYCRIRLARGKSVSLEPGIIIQRITQLEQTGHREVIITGVNLSQYKALYKGNYIDIASLLSLLIEQTGTISFRISSLYPERVDAALCAVLAHERIRPHFHLSVQSGSDKILQLMKRPYQAQQIIEAVERLRQIKKDAFIACDIITGFPGETEEDFQQTLTMCENLKFSWIHAFPFSARPGTEAYSMKPVVVAQTSTKRVSLLTDIAKKHKKAFVQQMISKDLKAVVEKREGLPVRAVTENFLHTELLIPEDLNKEDIKGKEVVIRILGESVYPMCDSRAEFICLL